MRQLNTIADYQALVGKQVSVAERSPSDPGHSFAGTVAGVSDDGRSLILSDVQELRYPDEDSPPSSVVPHSSLTLPLDRYEVLLIVDL
jgi:ribosome maturation factor RimP